LKCASDYDDNVEWFDGEIREEITHWIKMDKKVENNRMPFGKRWTIKLENPHWNVSKN
jgi:hypothetical protein